MDWNRFGELVQEQITKRLLSEAVVRLQSGQPVAFDGFQVRTDGIARGRRLLPWDHVQVVRVSDGAVSIRRKGGRLPWCKASCASVPNLFVFLKLLEAGLPPEAVFCGSRPFEESATDYAYLHAIGSIG